VAAEQGRPAVTKLEEQVRLALEHAMSLSTAF